MLCCNTDSKVLNEVRSSDYNINELLFLPNPDFNIILSVVNMRPQCFYTVLCLQHSLCFMFAATAFASVINYKASSLIKLRYAHFVRKWVKVSRVKWYNALYITYVRWQAARGWKATKTAPWQTASPVESHKRQLLQQVVIMQTN